MIFELLQTFFETFLGRRTRSKYQKCLVLLKRFRFGSFSLKHAYLSEIVFLKYGEYEISEQKVFERDKSPWNIFSEIQPCSQRIINPSELLAGHQFSLVTHVDKELLRSSPRIKPRSYPENLRKSKESKCPTKQRTF